MNHLENPNEISRESLVSILDIMHRLAAPEAMPELLREIIEVGKVAIVAETGVLVAIGEKLATTGDGGSDQS